MASTVTNASFIFRREKGLDCQNCVGLRAWTNLKFNCVGTAIKSRPLHLFVVRASESHNGAAPLKKLGLSGVECEAAIVTGDVPEEPPVPPKREGPAGAPEPLHRHLRLTGGHSTSSSFSGLSPANFVYPLFIYEVIYTDVALDPYSSDGYDGIVREDGAGADVGSPRDMMNGHVEANSWC